MNTITRILFIQVHGKGLHSIQNLYHYLCHMRKIRVKPTATMRCQSYGIMNEHGILNDVYGLRRSIMIRAALTVGRRLIAILGGRCFLHFNKSNFPTPYNL